METPTKARAEAMTDAINSFAFKLLKSIPEIFEENSVVSPFSIFQMLGMLYIGTAGQTKQDLANLLELPEDMQPEEFGWLNHQGENSDAEWLVANGIWPQINFELKAEFIDICQTHFQARLESLDYVGHAEQSKQRINGWIKEQTKGLIPSLIEEVDASTALVLTNAVYFFGEWREGSFDSDDHVEDTFFKEDGSTILVTYMTKTMNLFHAQDDKTDWIFIEYRGGYGLLLALPKPEYNLTQWLAEAELEQLESTFRHLQRTNAKIYMPKFSCSGEWDLLSWLRKQQIDLGPKGDFSGMLSSKPIFVSESKHKCSIQIDEKGTTAAAASSLIFSRGGFFGQAEEFKINRPFGMFLLDTQKGVINFAGVIREPKM
ncbi:MAG: serpin family protein [Bacteroidota bacterium]